MSSPSPAFHSGPSGLLKIPGTTPIVLPVAKWDLTIKGNNRDVSNARDGRYRIPGLQDAEGSFNMPYDSASDPNLAAGGGLVAGTTVTLNLYVDGATNFYAGAFIIDEVGPAMEIEGEIQFNVKFSLQSGTVTPPAA